MNLENIIMGSNERRLIILLGLYETAWILEGFRKYAYVNFDKTVSFYDDLASGYNT